MQGLSEERTVALERSPARPVRAQLKHLKTARPDLVDDDLRCDPEGASIEEEGRRWNIDHRQQATRAKRALQARVDRRRIGQVVVHAAQHDRIAAACRQSGLADFRFHDRNIAEPSLG